VLALVVAAGCGRIGFDHAAFTGGDGAVRDGGGIVGRDGGGGGGTDAGAVVERRIEMLSVGGDHGCAVVDGAAWCWGRNADGELGDGTTTDAAAPVRVVGLPGPVSQISCGQYHTCAVVLGNAWCWGAGALGELGDGAARPSNVPVAVTGLPDGAVSHVSAGRSFSCAVASGELFCFGSNAVGRLGVGTAVEGSDVPVRVPAFASGVTHVFAGGDHACAIVAGEAWCWGHNDGPGALGAGITDDSSPVPLRVVGFTDTTDILIGGNTACGLRGGAVSCWGLGASGELGDGAFTSSTVPVAVMGMESTVTAIGMGWGPVDSDAPCAVRGARLFCWGNNGEGRLGDGTTVPKGAPVEVVGLPAEPRAVAGGFVHACAVVAGERVLCWGLGTSGQLGDGRMQSSLSPVEVALPSD
jgi:alpha-tubulin suppressor-like RCC1 family protein